MENTLPLKRRGANTDSGTPLLGGPFARQLGENVAATLPFTGQAAPLFGAAASVESVIMPCKTAPSLAAEAEALSMRRLGTAGSRWGMGTQQQVTTRSRARKQQVPILSGLPAADDVAAASDAAAVALAAALPSSITSSIKWLQQQVHVPSSTPALIAALQAVLNADGLAGPGMKKQKQAQAVVLMPAQGLQQQQQSQQPWLKAHAAPAADAHPVESDTAAASDQASDGASSGSCTSVSTSTTAIAAEDEAPVEDTAPAAPRRRVAFAPGPLEAEREDATEDGHPAHEGLIARPVRHAQPQYAYDLSRANILMLEQLLGPDCTDSITRLKRRVGLLPPIRAPRPYVNARPQVPSIQLQQQLLMQRRS